ncbi:GNAT family N-acetyltransferase [Cohnella sp. GbtcB17]|uniref:GNAT family N-acetyltransferase n=1 Tax=Cohnella sp. GbtcB17 TaxID=2824762 RepID=UPI001C303A99
MNARLATLRDVEELSRLNQEFNGGKKRLPAKIIKRLNTGNELIAIAEFEGKIVGFGCAQSFYSFCYDEPYGEITELYVEEAARRKGIAGSIISCLEESLKVRGVKSVKVLTGRNNSAAIKTYEQCNYVKEDTQILKKRLID